MFKIRNYLGTAVENEELFRNILRDLKEHREQRPMGCFIPKDLETESSLDEIFKKYSYGRRHGVFSILNFDLTEDTASFSFQDVAIMSGGGAILLYKIKTDNTVEFEKELMSWRS